MFYIFTFLIALSLGGILFLGFRKFSFRNLVGGARGVFARRKRLKEDNKNIVSFETEEYWIDLIASDLKNPEHYKRLGEWYMYNNKEYAIKTFEHAVKLDPKDKKILKHLDNLKREEV